MWRRTQPPYITRVDAKIVQTFCRMVQKFLKELNINLPNDPAIPLQGILPREMKTYLHKNFTQICFAGLFRIVTNQKQSECPLETT
jgi:hypothetical protein